MIKPELLEILCCPKCKGDVRYESASETLICSSCGRTYQVKDGIPIMMVSDEE
ncbi:MAG: Trm112 family protein [Bacteroidota bacterium]